LVYVRRKIRECLRKLDRASIAELGVEHDLEQVPKSSVEEVQVQEAGCAPLVEARKAQIMTTTWIGGSPSRPKDRRNRPRPEEMQLQRIGSPIGACCETASPISPTAQSTIAPQSNIAASRCPACGQLCGSNALACYQCMLDRYRLASGGF
jgi:hypothetical protein